MRAIKQRRGASPGAGSEGLPISSVLVTGVALFVAASIGLVLLAGYQIARLNTDELIRENANAYIQAIIQRTRAHLEPVQVQMGYLADSLTVAELSDREQLGRILLASMAGVPQVSSIVFADPDLKVLRVFRNRPGAPIQSGDWSDVEPLKGAIEKARQLERPSWGDLFVAEPDGHTYLNLFAPVRVAGRYRGTLVAGLSIQELSKFLASLTDRETASAFVLYGKDAVLAHPDLAVDFPGLSDVQPLPPLEAFPDPVLARLWQAERLPGIEARFKNGAQVRSVHVDGDPYIFLYQDIADFGAKPWQIGTYFRFKDISGVFDRIEYLGWIGLAVVVASMTLAVALSRSLSQRIGELARAAHRITTLDLDPPLAMRRGGFRELNETAEAFEAMTGALRSFARYVPRSLVKRLLALGEPTEDLIEEREVTVMFTDLVGFTELAERMTPREVARLLNAHFTLVAGCVESQAGTVDKYIGDSVMAFWGAPGPQDDHASRACRAALCLMRDMSRANEERRAAGLKDLRVRVGLHTGRVFVGNIGAPTRINYTVIGDVVNAAERLEEVARTLADERDEVFVLMSGETADKLDDGIAVEPLGCQRLSGRKATTEVFTLDRTQATCDL